MIRIDVQQPFRWDALVRFLSARAVDAVESFAGGEYRRGDVRVRHEQGGVVVEDRRPCGAADLGGEGGDEPLHSVRARRMFDLDADPREIEQHLAKDPLLRKMMRPGTRVPGAWEPFEVAVRAIVGQQISVAGATTIMNRLSSSLTPDKLADADITGMPRSRADAIRGLARAVADDPTLLAPAATLEESLERLMALKGIGPWTANYIAMRAIHHPDAFPASDLGLVKAAAKLRITNLEKRAERWRPFRAYAAMLLWESL